MSAPARVATSPAETSRWLSVQPARRRVGLGGVRALVPALVLAAVTVIFCWKLLLAGLVVIGYDTMTYMYPYRFFAAEALRAGHLPLWNPYIYYGAPFLANLQSAVFYPLHVLFLILPATEAMNWSVALHLFLAAYFAAIAGQRILDLDPVSATVAGALYGLSGFVGAQVGHLNQLNAAAWLPAALTTLHLALTRRSARWTAATAIVLAIQFLAGHAQETFMTAVLLGAYTVFYAARQALPLLRSASPPPGAAIEPLEVSAGRARRAGLAAGEVARAGLTFGLAGGLAGGLAAMQLLPSNQLTALSIRSDGMSFGEAVAFSLPPRELFVGLLPTFGLAYPTSNEYIGWVGFGGLALGLLGLLFRVHRPATLFFAVVTIASFLLALGNHFPLYETLFHLPGMNLFRVPARWLLLCSFCGALIAGDGLMFLRTLGRRGWTADGDPMEAGPWRRLAAASRLLAGVVVVCVTAALLWPLQRTAADAGFGNLPMVWAVLAAAVVALSFWALAAAPSLWPSAIFTLWIFVELFAASRALEYNNPNPEWVYTATRPVIDALKRDGEPGRILSIAATGYHPSDADQLTGPYAPLLGPNGVLATLINTKYKEILSPNLPMVFHVPSVDGYDGGILPLRRYVEYKQLVVPPERNLPDSLLRDQLRPIPSAAQLRLLGAEYVIVDAISDVTQEGVFYDLASTATLAPGESRRFGQIASPGGAPPGPLTGVGLVTSLDGAAAVPDGQAVASVTVTFASGVMWHGQLVAGRDTAEGTYTAAARHRQPAPLGPAAAGGSATATYLARLSIDGVAPDAGAPVAITVQNLAAGGAARVRVHGISLIGAAGQSWPVTIAGDGALRLVHRSDVKLYRLESSVPRAYLAAGAQPVESVAAAIQAISRPGHDPQQNVIVERDPGPPLPARTTARALARSIRVGVKQWLGIYVDPRDGTVPDGLLLPLATTGGVSGGRVEWLQHGAEQLTLRVTTPQPGLLVLRDSYFPGWEAQIDGVPAPILRADVLFRAVPVPAGTHTVEFRFRSRALERGLLISALAVLATAAVAFFPWPRWWAQLVTRQRRRPAPQTASGAAGG